MLELALNAADAARLARLSVLRANGPAARSLPVEIIWHDTADGSLERAARIVASERGTWRLETLRPSAKDPWLPATIAPVIASAEAPEGPGRLLGGSLPDGLVPRAAFRGRRRVWTLENGGLHVELWQGALHGLTFERDACRLRIDGDPGAGAALAARLGEAIRLDPPRSSLAEEALAVAAGRLCQPHRLGTALVPEGASVEAALCHVVGHLAEVVIWWAGLIERAAPPEPVHQMRVATRRLRSALHLFKRAAGSEALAPFNLALRDLARRLGEARDWDVFIGGTGRTVTDLLPEEPALTAMLAAATRRRDQAYDAITAHLASDEGRRLLLSLALLPSLRPWRRDAPDDLLAALAAPFEDYAAHALGRLWKHLGDAGDELAALPFERIHDLRKHGKRLRYVTEFCGLLFPGSAMRRLRERLETLQEALGHVNDGHVAASLMHRLGGERRFAAGVVRGYVAAQGAGAMEAAETAWRKLRKQEVFWK